MGGSVDIPGGGCRCTELHLLDMECAPAKPRPRLAGRGQTGERHSPDWRTPWPMRWLALMAERWTGKKRKELMQLYNCETLFIHSVAVAWSSHLYRKVSYKAAPTGICTSLALRAPGMVTFANSGRRMILQLTYDTQMPQIMFLETDTKMCEYT